MRQQRGESSPGPATGAATRRRGARRGCTCTAPDDPPTACCRTAARSWVSRPSRSRIRATSDKVRTSSSATATHPCFCLEDPEALGAGSARSGSPAHRASAGASRRRGSCRRPTSHGPRARAAAARSAAARGARPCRSGSAGSTRSRRTSPRPAPPPASRRVNRSATPSASAFSFASSTARRLTSTAVTSRVRHGRADGQPDDAVPAAEVEDPPARRRLGLPEEHRRADVEPPLREDPRAAGQRELVAPHLGPDGRALERRRRVGGEVVVLVHDGSRRAVVRSTRAASSSSGG